MEGDFVPVTSAAANLYADFLEYLISGHRNKPGCLRCAMPHNPHLLPPNFDTPLIFCHTLSFEAHPQF